MIFSVTVTLLEIGLLRDQGFRLQGVQEKGGPKELQILFLFFGGGVLIRIIVLWALKPYPNY